MHREYAATFDAQRREIQELIALQREQLGQCKREKEVKRELTVKVEEAPKEEPVDFKFMAPKLEPKVERIEPLQLKQAIKPVTDDDLLEAKREVQQLRSEREAAELIGDLPKMRPAAYTEEQWSLMPINQVPRDSSLWDALRSCAEGWPEDDPSDSSSSSGSVGRKTVDPVTIIDIATFLYPIQNGIEGPFDIPSVLVILATANTITKPSFDPDSAVLKHIKGIMNSKVPVIVLLSITAYHQCPPFLKHVDDLRKRGVKL